MGATSRTPDSGDSTVLYLLATLAGLTTILIQRILSQGIPGPLGFACFVHGLMASILPIMRNLWERPEQSEAVYSPVKARKLAPPLHETPPPTVARTRTRLPRLYDDAADKTGATAAPSSTSADAYPVCESAGEESPLVASAALFATCLLGDDDVDVTCFMHACREYTTVLQRLGSTTKMAVKEVHSNMAKIEKHYNLDPVRFKSMRALLEDEMGLKKHSVDTGLVDPSAAVGLLWARRGLRYWLALFRPLVADRAAVVAECGDAWGGGAASATGRTGLEAALKAYDDSLAPYNGMMSTRLFKLAARMSPAWNIMGPKLAASPDALHAGMAAWSDAVGALIERMTMVQTQMNLECLRRGM